MVFFIKKLIVFIIIIISVISYSNKEDIEVIDSNSIRFRVIANSNEIEDQKLKIDISTDIRNYLTPLLSKASNLDDVRTIINSNYDQLDNIVKDKVNKSNVNYSYNINFGYNLFPEKEYNNQIFETGYYESLVVSLGKSSGANWWCILFPPLCLLEAEDNNSDNVEYDFYIVKIIKEIFS